MSVPHFITIGNTRINVALITDTYESQYNGKPALDIFFAVPGRIQTWRDDDNDIVLNAEPHKVELRGQDATDFLAALDDLAVPQARTVAAIRACRGLTTEELEHLEPGVLAELVEAARQARPGTVDTPAADEAGF